MHVKSFTERAKVPSVHVPIGHDRQSDMLTIL